jgi:mRNA-degrading endonuclease YafQ of YafQ-DinJ toxin-antitoxin module
MNNIEFDELSEFKKDFKHLLKKFRTLKEDLEVVKLDLNDEPGESPPFSFRMEFQTKSGGKVKDLLSDIFKV